MSKTNVNKKPRRGFTIIEVMIVLAVAGLISAVVFIAVPVLQRNERNLERREIANRIKSKINEFIIDHDGAMPVPDYNPRESSFGAPTSGDSNGNNHKNFFGEYIGCMNVGGDVECIVDVVDPSTGSAVGTIPDEVDEDMEHTMMVSGIGGRTTVPGVTQYAINHIQAAGEDPNADYFTDNCGRATQPPPYPGGLYYCTEQKCDGESPVVARDTRLFAFAIRLEGGSVWCVDNS